MIGLSRFIIGSGKGNGQLPGFGTTMPAK